MEKFDMTVFFEAGKYKLEECKRVPTKEELTETIDSLSTTFGSVKRIVIDNIK